MRLKFLTVLTFLLLLPGAVRADEAFFNSNGVKIHYFVEGKGEPVLLIHGFTASAMTNWGLPGVFKALTKNYKVIALDNRGHGKSEKPHDKTKYGMEMVKDSIRLLDHLKIKKAHIAGYSMGAMITAKLMTTYPGRCLTATLGGAAGIRRGDSRVFFNALADSLEKGNGIRPLIMMLRPPNSPQPTEEQIKAINNALTAMNDTKALAAVVRSFPELGVDPAKVKANQIPTLSLIGSNDPLKRGVDALKGVMPKLKVVVIDGAGHGDAPARPEFIEGLSAFLAKHSKNSAK